MPFLVVNVVALLVGAIYGGVLWDLSKSDWAAWVQAIGSIGAILVAVLVVQLQHSRQLLYEAEKSRVERRRQLNVLRWQFSIVAKTCGDIADMIGRKHVSWLLQAEVIKEQRLMLAAVPISNFPDASLLIRAQDLSHRLLLSSHVVANLKVLRNEDTLQHVGDMLRMARNEALIGITEATSLLLKISSDSEMKTDSEMLDSREENRQLVLEVLNELAPKDDHPSAERAPSSNSPIEH